MGRQWNKLGNTDPMWAVLTERGKRKARWDPEEFLQTGSQEIASVLSRVRRLGINVVMNEALDFGCGAGRLTQGLAKAGFQHVTGIDVASGMIAKAVELNRFGARCTFVANEVANLALLGSSTIDFVYSSRVLQHMPSSLAHDYIREFFRVARPGACVVFQLPERPAPTPKGIAVRLIPDAALTRLRRGMQMHGTKQSDVRTLVTSAGGKVVEASQDDAAGPGWISRLYVCQS